MRSLLVLLNPYSRRLDDLRPGGQLLLDEVRKLPRRAPHRMRAHARKALVEIGGLYRLDDRPVEPLDDWPGRARRHDDALPFDGFVARYASLGNGGNSWKRGIGLRARHGESHQPAGFYVRQLRGNAARVDLGLPADNIDDGGVAAA